MHAWCSGKHHKRWVAMCERSTRLAWQNRIFHYYAHEICHHAYKYSAFCSAWQVNPTDSTQNLNGMYNSYWNNAHLKIIWPFDVVNSAGAFQFWFVDVVVVVGVVVIQAQPNTHTHMPSKFHSAIDLMCAVLMKNVSSIWLLISSIRSIELTE